ncbi:MAG: hypothetical protein NC121_03710 [Blautia sp.]|nr:hypothetical protein [Blautia sp.]
MWVEQYKYFEIPVAGEQPQKRDYSTISRARRTYKAELEKVWKRGKDIIRKEGKKAFDAWRNALKAKVEEVWNIPVASGTLATQEAYEEPDSVSAVVGDDGEKNSLVQVGMGKLIEQQKRLQAGKEEIEKMFSFREA